MNSEMSGARELAEYAHALGEGNRRLDMVQFPFCNNQTQVALVPKGVKPMDMSKFIPAHPRIKEVALRMYEPGSFIRYVNEHKSEHSRIFASIAAAPYTFNAIIDWHETGSDGKADWCKHAVTLMMSLSDNYNAWKEHDGEFLPQAEFAEFLKDNRLDICKPDNAKILQLVMDLEATSEAKYNNKLPTNKGMTLSYVENVQTMSNGQQVDVPDSITLRMPIFTGMDPVEVECDFKFRASNGHLAFSCRILGIDKMIRDMVRKVAEKLEKETGLAVFI